MVNDSHRAYTTTYVNSRSIGIEMVGWARDEKSFTYALMNSLVNLCGWLIETYQIPLRHPNTTAYDYPQKGEYGWLNETGLYGHVQVQTCGSPPTLPVNVSGGGGFNCKTDPGPFFDWDNFIYQLSGLLDQPIQPVPLHQMRFDCAYTVNTGDKLANIARKFNMSYWEELCIYNSDILNITVCLWEMDITSLVGKKMRVAPLVRAYFPECAEYYETPRMSTVSNDLFFWLFIALAFLLVIVLAIGGFCYQSGRLNYTKIK
jgi:hypothetical protein